MVPEPEERYLLIEPNDNLMEAHLLKADDASATLRTSKIKDWQLAGI